MAAFDISDWWMTVGGGKEPDPARGMAMGVQMHQNRMQQDLIHQQNQIRAMDTVSDLLKTKMAISQREAQVNGMAELSSYISSVAASNSWDKPEARAKFWEIGARHPSIGPDVMRQMDSSTFEEAIKRKERAAELQAKADELFLDKTFTPRKVTLTSGEELLEMAPGRFQQPKGDESIETWTDPSGQMHTRIVRGNTKSAKAGDLTMATQSQVQQRMIGFEKSINMAADLYSKLDPSMLGVQGLMGELVVDRGLAQAFPEMADKQRINGRTLLRAFNEAIIKSLKVDAQVNRDEERRLLAALPSPGAVSSLPEAQEKIKTFMGLIKQQARIDADQSGKPPPDFTLTIDEVAKKVVDKQLTEQQAIDLINRYRIGQ